MIQSAQNTEGRFHALEAVAAAVHLHDALEIDDKRTALIEIDKVIALAHEVRKLLTEKKSAVTEFPVQPTPEKERE